MTGIVMSPDVDHPGEGDSREFFTEAEHLARLHEGVHHIFDNEDPNLGHRAATVEKILEHVAIGSCDWVAMCCHGWANGIQAGYDLRGAAFKHAHELRELARRIAAVGHPGIILPVALYACSTAMLPHGFASKLSEELAAAGCPHKLFAHTNAGHTTRNSRVRVYPGGAWLVEPPEAHARRIKDPAHAEPFYLDHSFWARWYLRTHDMHDDLRLIYPFLIEHDLRAELSKK